MRLILKAAFAFAVAALLTGQWQISGPHLHAEAADIAAAHQAAAAPRLFHRGTD